MPTQKKIEQVAEIEEVLANNAGFFIVDYRGLTVKQMSDLRKQLREKDSLCKVYKNNLVRRALAASDKPNMDELLDGPNAIVFFATDPASAGKVIKNFAKENKALELKGGLIDGAVADAAAANAIADLPSREELLSTVLATMLNPMSQIARVVDLIREQKENEAAAA
jgi:large subunit ribosomal protein L10